VYRYFARAALPPFKLLDPFISPAVMEISTSYQLQGTQPLFVGRSGWDHLDPFKRALQEGPKEQKA
jgi:hypothetical protein